jgi:type IV pilus assembly protein PilN
MIRINLLSAREAELEAGRRREIRLVAGGAAVVVLLLALLEFGSRLQLAPIRREHTQLQSDLKALEASTKELSDLEKNRSELEEKLKTIALLEQRKVGPVKVLGDLSEATPEQVWLLEFTETAGAATFTGLALDNQTIAAFMRNLSSSPFFASVDLVETTQSEQDGVPLKKFVVNARLSYSGQPLPPAPPDLKFPDPSRQQPDQPRKGKKA